MPISHCHLALCFMCALLWAVLSSVASTLSVWPLRAVYAIGCGGYSTLLFYKAEKSSLVGPVREGSDACSQQAG